MVFIQFLFSNWVESIKIGFEKLIIGTRNVISMSGEPLFEGLVFDEKDQLVETTTIGDEPCYVVDDDGFRRHIPAEEVDVELEIMFSNNNRLRIKASNNIRALQTIIRELSQCN